MKHPETGTTVFGRDAVGNLISRQVGALESTHYQYDGLNRLIQIDYPGTTPGVTQIYDANGNIVQSINVDAMREAIYDENDNLTIGGRLFTVHYVLGQKHVMPGNAVLPAHEGVIITRGLQEWACLLPQELPLPVCAGCWVGKQAKSTSSVLPQRGRGEFPTAVVCPAVDLGCRRSSLPDVDC